MKKKKYKITVNYVGYYGEGFVSHDYYTDDYKTFIKNIVLDINGISNTEIIPRYIFEDNIEQAFQDEYVDNTVKHSFYMYELACINVSIL